MTKAEYILLVEKVANGTASDGEIALYNASFDAFQKDEESWAQLGVDPDALEQESLKRFYLTIDPEVRKFKLWPRIAAAASIALAIGMGIWFYTSRPGRVNPNPKLASQQDIAPGKNTAVLTLANGKTITLSDARTGVVTGQDKLVYNDGSELGAAQGGALGGEGTESMLTMATPKGGTYQVTLPDGTKVWLNAASSIRFPGQFSGTERNVVLNGEAYFEVARDKKRPFRVSSQGQEITVLGTHFNLNSYADEPAATTTLVEGSVRVASLEGARERVVLKPNQQSVFAGGQIRIRQANIEEELAWKNGDFLFDGEDFRAAMRKVARWYNVEIIYGPSAPKQVKLGGWVSRNKNISAVLKVLESTGEIHFKIDGRRILVEK